MNVGIVMTKNGYSVRAGTKPARGACLSKVSERPRLLGVPFWVESETAAGDSGAGSSMMGFLTGKQQRDVLSVLGSVGKALERVIERVIELSSLDGTGRVRISNAFGGGGRWQDNGGGQRALCVEFLESSGPGSGLAL